MASNNKGVVTKNKFKFQLNFDAFCAMEEDTGKTVVELVNGVVSEAAEQGIPSVLTLRQWVRWAMLAEEPETTLSDAQAKCREMGLRDANTLLADLLIASKLVAPPSNDVDDDDLGNVPETDQKPKDAPAST